MLSMLPALAASLGKLLHMPLFGHKMWFSAASATALVTRGWCWCMLSHLNYWVHALLKVSISCSTLPYMVMRRGSKNSFLSGGAGRRVDLLAGPPIALILGSATVTNCWRHDLLQLQCLFFSLSCSATPRAYVCFLYVFVHIKLLPSLS